MTAAAIVNVITIIGSILLVLLKAWGDGAPQRKEEKREAEIQDGRAAIAGGDVGAVAGRIDRVLTVQETGGSGGSAELGPDSDTARRLAKITSS